MNLFESFKRLFSKKPQTISPAGSTPRTTNPGTAQKILDMLDKTQEKELSCDEVFALLDQFAEMAARGEDVASLMPMVKQHIDICPDCREEYESLLNVIKHTA